MEEEDCFSILCPYIKTMALLMYFQETPQLETGQLNPNEVNKMCTVPHRLVQFTIKHIKL